MTIAQPTHPTGRHVDLREAIIFDVDGTLVDVASIRHYLAPNRPYRDFDAFHKASLFCPPNHGVLALLDDVREAGHAVLIVTARRARYEQVTRDWLRKYDVIFDRLVMRADDDARPDVDVKRDILAQLRQEHRIVGAVDDNPSVIALWKSEQIPVVVVPGWDDPIVEPDAT